MNSRERVKAVLDGRLPNNERIPRHIWVLPWAERAHGEAVCDLCKRFPDDIVRAPVALRTPLDQLRSGDPYTLGTYVDEWGCVFENIQDGIIGEIKSPIVADWGDTSHVRLPTAMYDLDVDAINAFCSSTERYVLAGTQQRPFERMQFLRGTEDLFVDLALDDSDMLRFLDRVFAFYLEEVTAWSRTQVDAVFLMDDWGSQSNLLVRPDMWRRRFKPFYQECVQVAHRAGKRVFMHSDGYILDILPDLIEIGVDAINAQIFCMGLERLAPFRGQITFWGEMDRQQLLPCGSQEDIHQAVQAIHSALFAQGRVIAQCEFGLGAKPENVLAVIEAWDGFAS